MLSKNRLVRRIALALLAAATAGSLVSLRSTAKASTVCHWSFEDYIFDPVTNEQCGYNNNCTKEHWGCQGNQYRYYSHWITCPVGCCDLFGCGE